MHSGVIVTVYVAIDETLKALGHQTDVRAQMSDAEVLTVAVVAALYFGNHQERSLCMMQLAGYVRCGLSVSRYNRRLHKLRERLDEVWWVLTELERDGEVFIIDSMPVPVCKRVRAGRSKLAHGKAHFGYCAAKDEHFFGYRLHWVCNAQGVPVSFCVLPASQHDLTALDSLIPALPSGALVAADKGYISNQHEARLLALTGVRLVVARRKNMLPNTPTDDAFIRQHRHTIETANSQLALMGVQRLHVCTSAGLHLKLTASLLALVCAALV
jgi:hypothetical protein